MTTSKRNGRLYVNTDWVSHLPRLVQYWFYFHEQQERRAMGRYGIFREPTAATTDLWTWTKAFQYAAQSRVVTGIASSRADSNIAAEVLARFRAPNSYRTPRISTELVLATMKTVLRERGQRSYKTLGDQITGLSLAKNPGVDAFVKDYMQFVGAGYAEVVDVKDYDRLMQEAIHAGEGYEGAGGNFFAFSNSKDTARSVERTFVASRNGEDKGHFNNWVHTDEAKKRLEPLMKGSYEKRKMYVIPYFRGLPGSPYKHMAGVQLTDDRTVVLQMMKLYKVGQVGLDAIGSLRIFAASCTAPEI